MDDEGVIYATCRDGIDAASERLLLRTGLRPQVRRPATEEYPPERCRRMFGFDLWRLRLADGPKRDRVLAQAARRVGAFVAEAVVGREAALAALCDAHGAPPTTEAPALFEGALASSALAYLELRGAGGEGGAVKRLG